jgi:hypothetical protein
MKVATPAKQRAALSRRYSHDPRACPAQGVVESPEDGAAARTGHARRSLTMPATLRLNIHAANLHR